MSRCDFDGWSDVIGEVPPKVIAAVAVVVWW